MRKPILKVECFFLLAVLLFGASAQPAVALDVLVKGLFNNGAILEIDGRQRTLRAGERSPEGVVLVSADPKAAVMEINGERQTLGMSRRITTRFSEPEKAEVRIASGQGGHYVSPGRINGLAVEFMVDTGATAISMNLATAQRLGLNYRAGRRLTMATANGNVTAYSTMLDTVRVGPVEVANVEAVVTMGDFPTQILLGNSFLSRVEMRRESGVLVLEARF